MSLLFPVNLRKRILSEIILPLRGTRGSLTIVKKYEQNGTLECAVEISSASEYVVVDIAQDVFSKSVDLFRVTVYKFSGVDYSDDVVRVLRNLPLTIILTMMSIFAEGRSVASGCF